MSRLRVLLVTLTILAMAVAPLLIPTLTLGGASSSRAYAAAAGAPVSQDNDNDDDDDEDEDNDDADNDDDDDDGGDNEDEDNDDSDNDDGDDNGNGNANDNGDDGDVAPAPAPAAPSAPPVAACTTPGQETAVSSADGRVTARVFGSMTQSIKLTIASPIDPASVPPAPGAVVGGQLFQIIAQTCDGAPIAVLPAEINVGVSYSDADAAGLNESSFTLSRLDTSANQWRATPKQAADPAGNFTSATITEMGYYVLHQR